MKLRRQVRIKDSAELPSGAILDIDCNVELALPDIIRTFAAAQGLAEEWNKTQSENVKHDFYKAFAECIKTVIGLENWNKLLNEYDAHEDEIAECMKDWYLEVVIPAVGKASKYAVERKKRVK